MPGFLYNSVKGADEMRKKSFRSGFTMVETLIVIVVIAILAALGMLGVDEFVASAKATKIINNLYTLKTAVGQWYVDNSDKVVRFDEKGRRPDGITPNIGLPGQVTTYSNKNKKTETHPIQEWNDEDIHFSKYIGHIEGGTGIQLANEKGTIEYTDGSRQYTKIKAGFYGVCDSGSVFIDGKKITDRRTWYVGYRFKSSENAVKEKIKGRMKTAGVWFGTGDAHPYIEGGSGNTKETDDEAVWLQAFRIK